MKNYDAALTWLDQLLEVDPGSAIGRQLAGRIRMEQSGEEPTEMDPLVQVLADATAALKEGNTDSAGRRCSARSTGIRTTPRSFTR